MGIPGSHCGQPLPGIQPPGVSGFRLPGVSGVSSVQPLGVPLVTGDENLGVPVPLQLEVPGGQTFQNAAGQPEEVAGSSLTADGYQFNVVPAGTDIKLFPNVNSVYLLFPYERSGMFS